MSSVALTLDTQLISVAEGNQPGDNYTGNSIDNGYKEAQTADIWVDRTGYPDLYGNNNFYTLNVYGDAGDDYDLTSFDFNLNYDQNRWKAVSISSENNDLDISNDFQIFNSAQLADTTGSLRVVGGSASYLEGGAGGDGLLFSVTFEADDLDSVYAYADQEQYVSSTDFTVTVNENDTIVRDTSATSAATEEFKTATGTVTETYSIMEYVSDVEYSTSNIDFVTDLEIASGASTTLVREGSTIVSTGDLTYTNDGKTEGRYSAVALSGSVTGADVVISSNGSTGYGVGGGTDAFGLTMTVTGEAGDVLDYSGLSITKSFTNGDEATADNNIMNISKNLVTFQADINYDGRVSMMDLATLNAAAKAQTNESGIDLSSVNVDHVGGIDIQDLVKMDEQWGQSLHTANPLATGDIFSGNDSATIDLSTSTIGNSTTSSTDNSAFISQNVVENDPGFVGSLVEAPSVHTAQFDDSDTIEFVDVADIS